MYWQEEAPRPAPLCCPAFSPALICARLLRLSLALSISVIADWGRGFRLSYSDDPLEIVLHGQNEWYEAAIWRQRGQPQ
jgi:hypothetical protein